jgi:hypothetical protein
MAEGPLEFGAETPRPANGTRFDIYTNPQDQNRGRMVLNDLSGRYVVTHSEYADVEGTTVLRVWYESAPPA